MKNTYILFFALLFTGFCVKANAEQWYKGVVVLKDHQVLVGEMKYNSSYDLIQFKQENKVRTYSAHQVSRFDFYDDNLELHRKFISLPYQKNTSRYVDSFFEVVIRDDIKLLRKTDEYAPKVNRDNIDLEQYQYEHALTFNYFFEYDGVVIPSERFKRSLQPELDIVTNGAISQFIKDENLNTHETYDQIVVVRFYNKIMNDTKQNQLSTLN